MRWIVRLAVTGLAAVAIAVVFVATGCSPAQWNFSFTEDAGTDTTPFEVLAGDIGIGTTGTFQVDSGKCDPHQDIGTDSEVYLTSLTLSIWQGTTPPPSPTLDFAELDSVQVDVVLLDNTGSPTGSPTTIASLTRNPSDPNDPFLTGILELDIEAVDLATFLGNADGYRITVILNGTGPAADLRFSMEAQLVVTVKF